MRRIVNLVHSQTRQRWLPGSRKPDAVRVMSLMSVFTPGRRRDPSLEEADHLRSELVVDALQMALRQR